MIFLPYRPPLPSSMPSCFSAGIPARKTVLRYMVFSGTHLSCNAWGSGWYPFWTTRVSTCHLTLKMVFLMAVSSLKKIGDLQALSVSPSFLDFSPGLVKAIFHPHPYLHKPIHTSPWHKSHQLFICYERHNQGAAATRQTMSRWVRDAIALAYECGGFCRFCEKSLSKSWDFDARR